MIITIAVSDDLYGVYSEMNPINPREAMQKQLERFKGINPNERLVYLSGEAKRTIEALYGKPIEDPMDFAKWIKDLVGLKIGEETVPIRDGTRRRLTAEAKFYKKEPGPYIRERTKAALDQVWGAY